MMTLTLKITAPNETVLRDTFSYVWRHLNNHDFGVHASMGMGGGGTGQATVDLRIIDDAPVPPLTQDEIKEVRRFLLRKFMS